MDSMIMIVVTKRQKGKKTKRQKDKLFGALFYCCNFSTGVLQGYLCDFPEIHWILFEQTYN